MPAAYLTLSQWRARTLMPSSDVDALDALYPGWVDQGLLAWSRKLDARLAKRYATPFAAPVSEVVLEWLTALFTVRAYLKRGVNPDDAQFAVVKGDADTALAEIKEAADAEAGLYDLPLRQDAPDSTGIARGGPYGYSEASPYVWTDLQLDAALGEDENGAGTG